MKLKCITLLLLVLLQFAALTQDNVGIGVANPNPNALLELFSQNKGLLIPRLTTMERLAIPAGMAERGLLVYSLTDNLFYYWDGTQWVPFPGAATPGYNLSFTYNAATGALNITDGNGTLSVTLNPFNTSVQYDSITGTLSITDAGGTISTVLGSSATSYNIMLQYDSTTGLLSLTDGGGTLTTSIPAGNSANPYNITLQYDSITGTLSITDAGGTISTVLGNSATSYNFTLQYDSTTGLLSITDGGGTLTTTLTTVPDEDWSRDAANGVLYPFHINDQVAIGNNTVHASALVQMHSTSQGLLIPRMTTAQRNAISSPANGLQVYDTNARVVMFFNGTRWLEVGADPIGTINAFHKSMTGTPALPWGWAECNGQTLNDAESPYDGSALPDLNSTFNTEANVTSTAGRFLRGNSTSGTMASDKTNTIWRFRRSGNNSNNDGPANVPLDGTYNTQAVGYRGGNDGNGRLEIANRGVETHPGYMTVVWIIRVK